MKLAALLALIALWSVVVACGGSDSKSPPAAANATSESTSVSPTTAAASPRATAVTASDKLPTLDPCALLTKDEVATALGVAVADVAAPASAGGDCVFDEGRKGQRVFVQTGTRPATRDDLVSQMKSVDPAQPEAITGFGDIAIKNARAVGFIKNKRTIVIGETSSAVSFDAISTLAKAALQRAP